MRDNRRAPVDERRITRFNQLPVQLRLVYVDSNGEEENRETTANQAWEMAEQHNLDLVVIAPQAKPPVIRLCDYGKFKFAEEKHAKEMAKANRENARTLKEIRINQGIGPADYDRNLKRIREWLPNHDVRLEVTMKGRRGHVNRLSIPRGMAQEDMPRWHEFILNRIIRDLGAEIKTDRMSIGMSGISILVRPA